MVVMVNVGLGGMSSPPASTRTSVWGWNGAEWRRLDATGPPLRNLAGVAYDTRRQTLVMHGGTYDLGQSYNETWEWSSSWRQITGAGPGVRDHTQLAYDVSRGKSVLFGGNASSPTDMPADTWEYDGVRWERVATTGPTGRVHHAMAFDPDAGRVVLHGGTNPASGDLGDTWSWDGTAWTRLGAGGPVRTHARFAQHRTLGSLLLLGGVPISSSLSVWAQRNGVWTQPASTALPSGRLLTDAAYDERRNVLVLFGGTDMAGTMFSDTWEFDGTTWRRIGQ